MAKEITKKQYYQVIGLQKLAEKKNNELKDIEEALKEILEEDEKFGHISDCVFGELYGADELLDKLNIKVKED